MSFQRPTLPELIDRIQQDFVSRLGLVGSVLRRSMVLVMARVQAGAAHMMHGHLDYLGRQLFPDLSDEAFLIRQAKCFGISKNPAGFAKATATVTGSDGSIIPAGTTLLRSDSASFTVDADRVVASGSATLALTSTLAGADQTLAIDMILSFESPIAGVDSTVTVTSSTQDGSDEESTSELRTRFLEHLAEPAHGGNDADYIAWAKQVSGVTRAWVVPRGLGPGTVVLRFVRDDDIDLIPDSGEVAAVQAYLDTVAPAEVAVTVIAPAASPQAFTIHLVPDTTATRAAVTAELVDLYRRVSAPASTVLLSSHRTAIGTAAGVTDYVLTAPSSDVTHTANQLPTIGTITWT